MPTKHETKARYVPIMMRNIINYLRITLLNEWLHCRKLRIERVLSTPYPQLRICLVNRYISTILLLIILSQHFEGTWFSKSKTLFTAEASIYISLRSKQKSTTTVRCWQSRRDSICKKINSSILNAKMIGSTNFSHWYSIKCLPFPATKHTSVRWYCLSRKWNRTFII